VSEVLGQAAGIRVELDVERLGVLISKQVAEQLAGLFPSEAAAIAALPARAWDAGLDQDGQVDSEVGVAELTGLSTRTGWPPGQRLIVRRTRPAGRHRAKLTPLERKTGCYAGSGITNTMPTGSLCRAGRPGPARRR
jgi:hypothetical protein